MHRTQVQLGEEELRLLDQAAEETGASRSELIRRAVRSTYGDPGVSEKLAGLRHSAGSWKERAFTGKEYVDEIRSSLDERLTRLSRGSVESER